MVTSLNSFISAMQGKKIKNSLFNFTISYLRYVKLGSFDTMVRNLTFYFATALFWALTVNAMGQVRLDCCGIKVTVPRFVEARPDFPYKDILVEKNILTPFFDLKAPLALRVGYYGIFNTTVFDIQCIDNQMIVTKYDMVDVPKKDFTNSGYVDIGPDENTTNFLKKTTYSHLKSMREWNDFFRELVANHLFELRSDPVFGQMVEARYPKVEFVGDAGGMVIEVKIANNFRRIYYLREYYSKESKPAEVKYINNIHNIFLNLK